MDQVKIGKLIAQLRKSKNLTQRELGEMVGVGFRAVSKWENGLTCPDISIINELSEILGISADELLKGEVKNKEIPTNKKFNKKPLFFIIPIFLIAIIIISIILVNNSKVYIYELEAKDSESYYLEGEMIVKNDNVSLSINKIGFADKTFSKTMIKNYQYELRSGNTFLVGYGYLEGTKMLPSPIQINEWSENFKMFYSDKNSTSIKNIINNNMKLKFAFIDIENKEILQEINISCKIKEN